MADPGNNRVADPVRVSKFVLLNVLYATQATLQIQVRKEITKLAEITTFTTVQIR